MTKQTMVHVIVSYLHKIEWGLFLFGVYQCLIFVAHNSGTRICCPPLFTFQNQVGVPTWSKKNHRFLRFRFLKIAIKIQQPQPIKWIGKRRLLIGGHFDSVSKKAWHQSSPTKGIDTTGFIHPHSYTPLCKSNGIFLDVKIFTLWPFRISWKFECFIYKCCWAFVSNFIEIDRTVEHPLIAEPRDLLIFRFQVRTYDVCDQTEHAIVLKLL